MINLSKTKILWSLFSILNLFIFLDLLILFFQKDSLFIITLIQIFLTIVLYMLYALWYLGYKRTILFILLTSGIGFIFELIGMKYGAFFGESYYYESSLSFQVYGVPLLVPIFWTIFIYIGYNITNSFLVWTNKRIDKFWIIPFLVLLDGIIVTAIDIFLDPLMVEKGYWIWIGKGLFFGIPIYNFFGWFIVTILSTFVFRIFEFIYPQESRLNSSLLLIPVIWYAVWCIYSVLTSIRFEMYTLSIVGFFAMFPISLISILMFLLKSKK